jgi:hypothetical protein
MSDFKGEKIVTDGLTKEVYFFYDDAKKIKQISSEVYKKKDIIIQYPRGFEGGQKYKTIKKLIFKGFKGNLPVGVYKSAHYGWGFTRVLNPFAYYLNDNHNVTEIIIEKKGKVELDITNKKLYLNEASLVVLHDAFSSVFKKNKAEVDYVLKTNLHSLFPTIVQQPEKKYIEDALASSLELWGNSIEEFSDADKKAIRDLFDKLSFGTDFLTKEALAKTKEIIDTKYIQETLKKYKELMLIKTNGENLEKHWQVFLRDNSWIFSSIFAQPVILCQREAYVGGKTIDNTNGKFNDFLIKNSLSDNISFLEIKTHKTKLMDRVAYRGVDVYSATKDLTGCIVQVLNQRDNFQKEFYALKGKSKQDFETFNSKCVFLIGSTNDLNENQKYSFELYRSNSRDVEILTFNELQTKIESMQKVMTNRITKRGRK